MHGKVLVPRYGEVVAKKGLPSFNALTWQYVPDGAPWRRTLIWQQPAPTAEPTPTTQQPRRFVSISRTIFNDDTHFDAIADDGTAWWCWSDPGCSWEQHPPLPPREVPADA